MSASHEPKETSQSAELPTIRELVGHVWVDSGQLIVTDPSYIDELDYETIEAATTHKKRFALVLDGMAAAFRSGLRNGRYPVFVTRYENGAIVRFEVEMSETLST